MTAPSATLIEQLTALRDQALAELAGVQDEAALEHWRVEYLGRRGRLAELMRGLGRLAPDERPQAGRVANEVKDALEQAYSARAAELERRALQEALERERIDVTLPGRRPPLGQVHPITRTLREIVQAFQLMGFQVVEGPEVEWDYYNFEALNIPPDHPARDMWDTFYITDPYDRAAHGPRGPMLLRTHTSPMQIRIMEQTRPPVRVIVPGKVYRYEATDATHESQFYQVEGLAVDRGITMADLKGVLTEFARLLFGAERRVRFYCSYFPFVEPGVEVAIDCYQCRGAGCRLCGFTGWLEILGAGMVHPNVLAGVNYDPAEYTGFAFGMGVERIAMLKYGVDDIRLFYANDLRFLRQFR